LKSGSYFRIFKYFDDDNDGFINREEWILGLSVFLKGEQYVKGSFELLGLHEKDSFPLTNNIRAKDV